MRRLCTRYHPDGRSNGIVKGCCLTTD